MPIKEKTSLESIIAAIGGEIDREFESHWQIKFRYQDLNFLAHESGDKYSIGLYGPLCHTGVCYANSEEYERANVTRSIGVSVNRKPEDAAKDFKRRIDVATIKRWFELRKIDEQDQEDYNKRSLELAQIVAGVAGGSVRSSSSESHYIHVDAGGKWYSMSSGVIHVQGQSVSFDIRGVTDTDLIRDLAAVLEKHRKK